MFANASPQRLHRLAGNLAMRLIGRAAGRFFRRGSLTIIAPDASARRVGDGEPHMIVRLLDWRVATRLLFDPELALGEAYMDGTLVLEGGDVFALFQLCYANIGFSTGLGVMRLGGVLRRWRRKFRRASVLASRRNVAHHYDLSDALYARFLDADRQYSCAYFAAEDDTLDIAQARKKRHVAAKLRLRPGQRVLDIGCGWGGLAAYLAEVGQGHVTGLTLSSEQLAYASKRVDEAGLAARVRILPQDYAEHAGRYDRIVSVGMLEHVGAARLDRYFETVRELLEDDGVALIHTIGRVDGPGFENPWIDKYIFPGGFIPALSEIVPAVERARLYVTDIEVLRLHYARTLAAWRQRFQTNRAEIAQIYDERFCRMWEFYLAASEASFRREGGLAVYQIQLSKTLGTLPEVRDYMVDWERENAGDVGLDVSCRVGALDAGTAAAAFRSETGGIP